MSIVRQMPELLLRGSLANVTMANLTVEEQAHVSEVMEKVVNHPEMARHKFRFITELGGTIGADYNDDRQAAEMEFNIAIWRAVVSLFYHRKYTFECLSCGSLTYTTKVGRVKALDRQYPVCPNCRNVRVTHQGETDFEKDSYVQGADFQKSYEDFTPVQDAPRCESPIRPISGEKIYNNPEAVINDDRQLVKFFGEFVWNYFRQILKENSRAEHRKTPQLIHGPGDYIIVQEIISLCSRMKLEFSYCSRTQPENGGYHIMITGLQTPPEFSAEFAVLRQKGINSGIIVDFTDNAIVVNQTTNAPTLEAFVVRPEHVLVVEGYSSESKKDPDGRSFTVSQVSYRTIGTERMHQEDQTENVDNSDVVNAVRNSLPDGDCKQVFDIFGGRGDAYIEFSEEYGDGKACINHIARHLKITTRAVNQHKEVIKVNMLAAGLTPQ
jgi:hypothetical protein